MTIKDLILTKYISMYAFAKDIGWTPQRVHQLKKKEVKNMNLSKLREICDFLDVDLKELI